MENNVVTRALTEEEVAANKNRFISIIHESGAINRPGMDKLLAWLETTDFFVAPASTKFHGNYAGGLCMHSLNVYDEYKKLFDAKRFTDIDEASVAICALFHDLCKANFYKESTRNVKNEETGKWEKVPCYQIEDMFPYGHGEKSVFLMERFIRLRTNEAVAIRWHMGGFDNSVKGGDFSQSNAYNMYPCAPALHIADLMSTYLCGE